MKKILLICLICLVCLLGFVPTIEQKAIDMFGFILNPFFVFCTKNADILTFFLIVFTGLFGAVLWGQGQRGVYDNDN